MMHSPLLLQLVVILVTARILALLLRWFGQPPVIGEMIAGIVLGPIVFGALAPSLHAQIFPKASLGGLDGLSQIGLVLFMFIVGAELRMQGGVRKQMTAAGWVGILSVLLPMAAGIAITPLLYGRFAPAGVGFWTFALFMAASMAITAFPIMARILKERAMTHTPIGRLALTSAAIADVFAWIMLAVVVALISSGGGWVGLVKTLGGLLLLTIFVFAAMRPLMAKFLTRYAGDGKPHGSVLAILLIWTFVFAAATQALQVHAVFGAFLFGACLPRDDRLLRTLIERIEYIAVLVLMPVFFALAGLNTTRDAFVGAGGGALALILGAAVLGKLLGGALGARLGGSSWRDALAVGSLMNARALMELIVMKVGLDAGVIGKEIFTMLMVMAIATTIMTTPMLILFAPRGAREAAVAVPAGGGPGNA